MFLLEVNVIRFIMDYMPYRNQQLSGHGHDDLHLVFLPDLCLMVGEPAEEAALCSACRPCALDDVLSELDSTRQNYLLDSIGDIQTIITCTGLDEFINNRFTINKVYKVTSGTVEEMSEESIAAK